MCNIVNYLRSSFQYIISMFADGCSSLCSAISRAATGVFSSYPLQDQVVSNRSYSLMPNNHLKDLVDTQKNHLAKLQTLANAGQWQHIQTHTSHGHSGFDWWMFPIKRPSLGKGTRYTVNDEQIKTLKANPEFMKSYRDGVILVAKSWGWDLEKKNDITNDKQKWVGYNVRLGKMIDSLRLFDQQDLLKNLVYFIDMKGIRMTLDPWIQNLLIE